VVSKEWKVATMVTTGCPQFKGRMGDRLAARDYFQFADEGPV
jgi:hypothetical protein